MNLISIKKPYTFILIDYKIINSVDPIQISIN